MDLDQLVNKRASIRKFHKKRPNWRDLIDVVDCARKIPLAGNLSSIKFIIVDSPEIIADLAEASQQEFVADANFVIVVVSDIDKLKKSFDEKGEEYGNQQAGAAIEVILLKLVELGLGGCWVGDFIDEQVKRALKVPTGSKVEAIIPVGYPLVNIPQRRKPSLDRCLYFNKYKGKFMKNPNANVDAF
jgi:nitroreductase